MGQHGRHVVACSKSYAGWDDTGAMLSHVAETTPDGTTAGACCPSGR